jgi:hypothetical protein
MNKIEGRAMSADVMVHTNRNTSLGGVERVKCALVKPAEETADVEVMLQIPSIILTGNRRFIADTLELLNQLVEEVTWASKFGWRMEEEL